MFSCFNGVQHHPVAMKVVALVSGGKDSCFSMLECVRNGHEASHLEATSSFRPGVLHFPIMINSSIGLCRLSHSPTCIQKSPTRTILTASCSRRYAPHLTASWFQSSSQCACQRLLTGHCYTPRVSCLLLRTPLVSGWPSNGCGLRRVHGASSLPPTDIRVVKVGSGVGDF